MALIDNLVSYYNLDETSGDAVDSQGDNDGTVDGATQGVTGKINTAYDFDGNDFINIDSVFGDLASTTEGTWSAWIKPDDGQPLSVRPIVSFLDTSATTGMDIDIQSDGKFQGISRTGGTVHWILKTDDAVFSDGGGVWYHVAIVHNGTEPKLYVDGVAPDQTFTTDNDRTRWFSDNPAIDNGNIGARFWGGSNIFFDGTIDEVGFWGRDLSPSEISELYNDGDGLAFPFQFSLSTISSGGFVGTGEKEIRKDWPVESGLEFGTTKQEGDELSLVPTELDLIEPNERRLFHG